MTTKKKNLLREDIEEVKSYEDSKAIMKGLSSKVFEPFNIPLKFKPLNKKQEELQELIANKTIIMVKGIPGSGKTYVTLGCALDLIKNNSKFKKICLIKSLQVIKGEELGFLPGTLQEKMEPYMYSFTGNLDKLLGSKEVTKKLIEKGVIEITPIAFARGVNLDQSIITVDEAQNIDYHTFKTLITRIGFNSKIIFLGDVEQIDRKNIKESCFEHIFNLFKDKEFCGAIEFTDEDCIRNPIIPKILNILKDDENK